MFAYCKKRQALMRTGNLWIIKLLIFFSLTVFGIPAYSQALLPHISVYYQNGKNVVSWTSGYKGIKQIGVQRSQDSLVNYSTIGHAADPDKKVNQFIDSHPQPGKNFYRLFVLFTNNSYFFTDAASLSLQPATLKGPSVSTPQVFTPSIFVYTNPDGNVNISLAQATTHRYDIRFFDEEGHFLFAIKDIHKPFLILDKSNFMRAGWYHYELYEDGKIKEKWKFYIADSVDK